MRCPFCNGEDIQVLETRVVDETALRRRRRCVSCDRRFFTQETVERKYPLVIKKNRARIAFDQRKLANSFEIALNKRRISAEQIEQAVVRTEERLIALNQSEVSTAQIGEMVMSELKNLDAVAYIRYASVYKDFDDVTQFQELLHHTGLPDPESQDK